MEMVACGLFGDFWFEYVSDFLVLVVGLSLGFDGGEKDREAVSSDLASPTVDMPKPPMRNSGIGPSLSPSSLCPCKTEAAIGEGSVTGAWWKDYLTDAWWKDREGENRRLRDEKSLVRQGKRRTNCVGFGNSVYRNTDGI
ncbi:unnamed protein product [Linum trigynum]|uniref:Uncharacterized protein n=1 Tax=Linum trigynum TaxID=586398 RepID=A0AAV2CM09_9ROSI